MSDTHLLMLTDSPETAQLVPGLLQEVEGLVVHCATAAGGEALVAVTRHQPQVIVLADTLEHLPTVVATLDAASPEVPQVVILPEGDAAGAVACGLAGARATLIKPFERQRLLEAIQIVHARHLRLQQQQAAGGGTVRIEEARQQRPRVIAVHGAKGGEGATTIACNLAVALQEHTGRRVALIDGDLLSGDVGVLCGLLPKRTIVDLLPEIQMLDVDILENAFAHHASSVHVLLAPEQLQQAEPIKANEVKGTLVALRPYFDYQIVDTASSLVPVSLAVMDEADLIVLVVTPGLASLRNAARFLRLAAQLSFPKEKIMLVANRADTGQQIGVRVIEEQLQRPVVVAIPYDAKAPMECMNVGELLVQAYPRGRIAERTRDLARSVAAHLGWEAQGAARRPPSSSKTVAKADAHNAAVKGAPPAAAAEAPAQAQAQASVVHRLARWLTASKREPVGTQ